MASEVHSTSRLSMAALEAADKETDLLLKVIRG